jgi:glycerophosphoryl diester phosphodiesterase
MENFLFGIILVGILSLDGPASGSQSSSDRPPKPAPAEPVRPAEIETAIRRGIDFLVACQNEDGSFGNHFRTKDLNIYAPVPGALLAFQSATTALGICALIESGDQRSEVLRSLERAETWLLTELPKVRRATPDAIYNVWSHAYGIKALTRMYQRRSEDEPRRERIRSVLQQQVDWLKRYELVNGGWGYYDFNLGSQRPAGDSSSFTTGTVMVALWEAKQLGIHVPEPLIKRATASILRQKKADFSYLYGEYLKWNPMRGINRPAGSLGRSQVCNLALRLWGDKQITDEILCDWLNRLISRNLWLDLARKRPIPHESFFQVSGYFFFYGHYYAALCMELLPPEEQSFYQNHLASLLIKLQEKDGSWWDYPLYNYHQAYGTSYALMVLHRCRPRKGLEVVDPEQKPASPNPTALQPVTSPSAYVIKHSHNDYFRPRPLEDALEAGFESVEADVHLVDGKLLVGHDQLQLKPERTLESMYLKPLQVRVAASGNQRVQPHSERFYLLVDVKTAAEPTYHAIDAVLRKYPDLFSEYRDGRFIPRAVTVVISGNVARETILKQSRRFAGFDGREADLWSDVPVSAMPWISESWSKLFKWRGGSPMPEEEREKLAGFVGAAHTKGRLVRFWGLPEREDVWQQLLDHRVDILGTDLPQRLKKFLSATSSGRTQVSFRPDQLRLSISSGDRIVLLAGTFGDRDRHFGWFETILRQAFPGERFRVRNLSWPGDTIAVQLRPLNYPSLEQQLADYKPTIIFVGFGMSEAFEGPAYLPAFTSGLRQFLDRLAQRALGSCS